MSLKGFHKVLGHYGGRFHFAAVSIDIEISNSNKTNYEIVLQNDVNRGEIFISWKNAAIQGLKRFVTDFPGQTIGKLLVIREILATLVDTEDETLKIASYIAAYKAFFPNNPIPEISYDGVWKIIL